MQLLNQIIELDEELDKVLLGEGNTLAINKLEAIYTNITPPLNDLALSFNCRKLYKSLPGDYSIKAQSEEEISLAHSVLVTVKTFIATWGELEKKHTISQDDICSDTRDGVKRLSKELTARNTRQYKGWINQILDEVQVSESDLEQQENSPNLKDNAFKYRELYKKFRNEVDIDSPTEITIRNLISHSNLLVQLKDKMEFDQPDDVVKLFEHLRQPGHYGRAPINMLTKQVIEWMADKGQESYFYIGDSRIGNRR